LRKERNGRKASNRTRFDDRGMKLAYFDKAKRAAYIGRDSEINKMHAPGSGDNGGCLPKNESPIS
jgi:hypothetical protein